jgi:uncharacterized membrane protein YfcA
LALWILIAATGLCAGVLSGIFGIGGGLIIVPALVLLGGWTVAEAAGTSLAALLLPVGQLGAYVNWRAGQVNVVAAAILAVGLFVGAAIGARIGLAAPPDIVQRSLGVLLLLVGIRLVLFVGASGVGGR